MLTNSPWHWHWHLWLSLLRQGNDAVTDEGIIALVACPKIHTLNLSGCFRSGTTGASAAGVVFDFSLLAGCVTACWFDPTPS